MPSTQSGTMSTRHSREGDGPDDPSDGRSNEQIQDRVVGRPRSIPAHSPPDDRGDHDSGGEDRTALLVKEQLSHEDVARLEADNDRMHRNNEAKNMVFDAIYDQLPDEIQSEMSSCGVGWRSKDSGFQFSKLSEAELKKKTSD